MLRYVFYDLETSGLNPCFDQILEYGAVTTDDDGHVLDEVSYAVALRPDVIPTPQALLTHQLPIFGDAHVMTELDAVRAIHQQFIQPNTISLGYNSLSFDDTFLRFAFYRHLLPPYQHQYANGCYRMDVYPMLVFYFLYQPDVMSWPKLNEKVSLKLEHLNMENQWAQGQSHHALFDVHVTLKLTACLQQQKKMWDYLQGFFKAEIDAKRTQLLPIVMQLKDQPIRWGLLIDPSCGARDAYQVPVLCLGHHARYKKQMVLLRLDLALPDEIETAWVIRKKYGEPGFLLPPQEKYLQHLTPERMTILQTNLTFLNNHPAVLQALVDYHSHWEYPLVADVDLDAALYQMDFYRNEEIAWCERFHQAAPHEKTALLEKVREHAYLYPLGVRLLGRYFPENLSASADNVFQNYLMRVFNAEPNTALRDYKGASRLTAAEAFETTLALLEKEQDANKRSLLNALQYYLNDKIMCVN